MNVKRTTKLRELEEWKVGKTGQVSMDVRFHTARNVQFPLPPAPLRTEPAGRGLQAISHIILTRPTRGETDGQPTWRNRRDAMTLVTTGPPQNSANASNAPKVLQPPGPPRTTRPAHFPAGAPSTLS